LAAGARIHIGSCLCEITRPLGMGSFGVVWAGENAAVGAVAVKEILCRNEMELSRALYEAELLKNLTSRGTARLPAFVATETASLDSEICRLRLVMSRIDGDPLDKFLQERGARLQADPSSSSSAPARQVRDAFRYAHSLVSQLVPTMDVIAAVSYHRDVNAHNILVEVKSEGEAVAAPQYGLVDFGLAVAAERWMDPSPCNAGGASDWEFQDVGGDCRYWPTSAWRQFEVGCYELAQNADLCLEYQTHLDLQGLGITTAQVLAEMLPPLPLQPSGPSSSSSSSSAGPPPLEVDGSVWEALQVYLSAWGDYWQNATRFWAYLLQTFRNGGDWNALKNEFIELRVHALISETLQRLRASIVKLDRACRRAAPAPWTADTQAVLPALLVMISAGERRSRQTCWDDVHQQLLSGQQYRSCANTTTVAEEATLALDATVPIPIAPSIAVNDSGAAAGVAPAPVASARAAEQVRLPPDLLARLNIFAGKVADLRIDMERLARADRAAGRCWAEVGDEWSSPDRGTRLDLPTYPLALKA